MSNTKKYRKSKRGKELHKLYSKKYRDKNPKREKQSQRKYRESKKGKKIRKQYRKSVTGKLNHIQNNKKYKENNPEKINAHRKLNYLFRRGNIDNGDFICALCENQPIEKHHENYDIWYSFIPLCKNCHRKYSEFNKNALPER